MYAVEFETRLEQGVIPVPPAYLNQLGGRLKVIILKPDLDDSNDSYSPLVLPNLTTLETLQAVDRQEGLETVTLEQLQSVWQQAERE
jgi:hypothetical protein